MNSLSWLLVFVLCACCSHVCRASDDFTFRKGPVPKRFRLYQRYPDRPEEQECQPIRLHIERNSRRYSDLVQYTATNVNFATPDSRRMSSRLHSRLYTLGNWYRNYYYQRLVVLKAWTPYPDNTVSNDSLHYEGKHCQTNRRKTSQWCKKPAAKPVHYFFLCRANNSDTSDKQKHGFTCTQVGCAGEV